MNILVTGAGGLLGSAFLAEPGGNNVTGIGRAALDISRPDRVRALAARHQAHVLINCAADTDVEGAETQPERAFAANTLLPSLLAQGCRESGTLMIQISSTGCYGDWKATPYVEEDEVRPTTVYHRAKLAGEDAVRQVGGRWLILRAGWLYGGAISSPKNFVARRLEEATGKTRLAGNAEQRGNPTFVGDFVRQTLHLVARGRTGLFNCVAHGEVSRAAYVREIISAAGIDCVVTDAPASLFARRAPVSPNEMAHNRHLAALQLDVMPEWRTSLASYVRSLT